MSLSYGFIASTYNDHIKHTVSPRSAALKLLEEANNAPPSYSYVLAEKYQQECTLKLGDEISALFKSMKRSMQEAEILLISYQHCCQRLEIKNQHLIRKLQLASASNIDTTAFSNDLLDQSEQIYQQDADDSLVRMNISLEKLIREAESSLQTHLSLPEPSTSNLRKNVPQEDISLNDEYKLKSQQQKNRYLYSQWKLAFTMKQLLSTVQHQEHTIHDHQIHHYHHHIHHHIYHHADTKKSHASVQEPIYNSSSDKSIFPLTSLFKYAMDAVGGLIPQQPLFSNRSALSKSVKYRTIFLSSLLILQRYNKHHLWIRRSQYLILTWKSRRFQLYTQWVQKAHLLHFMLQIFASSSSLKRHLL